MSALRAFLDASTREPPSVDGGLVLAVLGECGVTRYGLPREGAVIIGRSADAAIQIVAPWISRQHARLSIESGEVVIEDLGSANGTRVRTRALRGGRASIAPGDSVELGATVAVLSHGEPGAVSSRGVDRGGVAPRLAELVADPVHARLGVAVLALRAVATAGARPEAAREASRALREAAQAVDTVFVEADGTHVLALTRGRAHDAARIAARIDHSVRAAGHDLLVGLARFPEDAREPARLSSLARARMAPPGARGPCAGPVVASASMVRARAHAAVAADGDGPVVVWGEAGVGKREVAAWIHQLGRRAEAPLLHADAATVDDATLALAAEGTCVVSGAEALVPEVASALAVRARRARARLVLLATTGDPRRAGALARSGGASAIGVAPLRDRADDVAPLASRFLSLASGYAASAPAFTDEAIAALRSYAWPGNVRELAEVVFAAHAAARDEPVARAHLPERIAPRESRATLHSAVEALERARIVDALALHGENQVRAARALGIARNTLIARMRRFGLTRAK